MIEAVFWIGPEAKLFSLDRRFFSRNRFLMLVLGSAAWGCMEKVFAFR